MSYLALDLEEKKGELEELSRQHKEMKGDRIGVKQRQRKLLDSLYQLGNKVKD